MAYNRRSSLLEGFPHESGDGMATIVDIPIVAEDGDGNTDDATTQVDVIDSVPVAVDDYDTIPDSASSARYQAT